MISSVIHPSVSPAWEPDLEVVGLLDLEHPVDQLAPQLIERSGALAETEEVLADLDTLSTGDTAWLQFRSIPLHAHLIGTEWLPLHIRKGETSAIAIDPHYE